MGKWSMSVKIDVSGIKSEKDLEARILGAIKKKRE